MLDWNPEQYEKFIKDRTQPAIDLANRLEFKEAKRILDLGCGTGNSTKILKDRYPNARVIGADNSDEMLAKAKKTHPDIEFIHLDVGGDLGLPPMDTESRNPFAKADVIAQTRRRSCRSDSDSKRTPRPYHHERACHNREMERQIVAKKLS